MLSQMGLWAPIGAISAMIIVSFLPIPAETVAIVNGVVFGRWQGFIVTWIGAMLAALIAFAISRSFGRPVVSACLGRDRLRGFETLVNRRGASYLLLARMIPLVPYTVVNYGCGLSPVRVSTFVWTSAIGMAPPIFAFVSVGALMEDQPWLGWVSLLAVFILFALTAYAIRRRLRAADDRKHT